MNGLCHRTKEMSGQQQHIRRPGDSGIHTVEGNVAGARAASLARQREKDAAAFAEATAQSQAAAAQPQQRTFASQQQSASSETTVLRTAGLKTAEEFKRLQKQLYDEVGDGGDEHEQSEAKVETEEERVAREKAERKERKRKRKEKQKLAATLSFAGEEELDEEDETAKGEGTTSTKISKKDPTIDTSFLPDQQREKDLTQERKRLEHEWKIQQATLRQTPLTVTYSYWDGSGHRRSVDIKQGDTIGSFLESVRRTLCVEFRELSNIAADALLYIKEDLILPHDLTFYDLIVSKARGKSGPLFEHSVVEDVRLGPTDVRQETTESHPGKIVQRHWYERNKHIFPACRWEVFDPTKNYGKYSIGDRNKKGA